MIKNKRGLSEIVTNVLIILLVLVSVGIIWAVLNSTIRNGTGQLGGAADCLTVQLEPISCDSTNNEVTLRRGAGEGALKEVSIVVSGTQNAVETFTKTLDPLEIDTFTIGTNLAETDVISVAAVVDDGSGGSKTCSENSVTITC